MVLIIYLLQPEYLLVACNLSQVYVTQVRISLLNAIDLAHTFVLP